MKNAKLRKLGGAVLMAALAMLLVTGLSGAMAAKKSKLLTKTVSSGDINLDIPDAGVDPDSTESTVRVPVSLGGIPNKGNLTDVNVGVRISDTAGIGSMRDLDIHLATPRGVVKLSTDNGGISDDFGSGADSCAGGLLVFDSQAGNSITDQNPLTNPPVTGTFAPEEPLQVVNGLKGLNANGTWTLLLSDDDPIAAQTIRCFNLDVQYQTPKKKKKKKKKK